MSVMIATGIFAGGELNFKLRHEFVVEDKPRIQNRTINFTGTVRTCGVGGTYSTLTAAYNASSSDDIIQLTDNTTITLSGETGGYLLLNTPNKRILIRGNATDRTKCTIQQNAAASFGIRMRDCGELVLQDLTLVSNQNNSILIIETDYGVSRLASIINCKCDTLKKVMNTQTSNTSLLKNYEIINSELNSTDILTFQNLGINSTIYLKNNIINSPVFIPIPFTGTFCEYDNIINVLVNGYINIFGLDTDNPGVGITGLIDMRGNKLSYNQNTYGHAVLLGRGTNKLYCVNNIINVPDIDNSLALGIVNKATASVKGDCIIKGNYINAPRPYYIKGAQNTIAQNNSFITNAGSWEAFGFVNPVNPDGSKLSFGNEVINNNFVGRLYGINVYNGGASESEDITIKTCTIDNNKYYFTQNYLYKGSTNTQYSFANRNDYWTPSINEQNSSLIPLSKLPIKE